MDAGTAPFQFDLDVLRDRILKARILREHHVWEAAKALSTCRHGPERNRSDRRFAALMEADALVDATLLLAAQARPPRSLAGICPDQAAWICTMRCECGGGARCFEARHADLAAALLGALLQSYRDDRDGKEPDNR
jgi:hypothetical protein